MTCTCVSKPRYERLCGHSALPCSNGCSRLDTIIYNVYCMIFSPKFGLYSVQMIYQGASLTDVIVNILNDFDFVLMRYLFVYFWVLGNTIQLIFNQNTTVCIQENEFEYVVCQISAILSQDQCINLLRPSDAYMRQYTNHHWYRQWLVAWPVPTHYLNQCWNIVDWIFRNNLQWNLNWNSYISIKQNTFENTSGKWQMFCLGLNVLNVTLDCILHH